MMTIVFLVWMAGAVVNSIAFAYALGKYGDKELKDISSNMIIAVFMVGIVLSWGIPGYFVCEKAIRCFRNKGDGDDEEGAAG